MAREAVPSRTVLKLLNQAGLTQASFTTHVDDAALMVFPASYHCSRKLAQLAEPSHERTGADRCMPPPQEPPGSYRRGKTFHINVAHILAVQPILQFSINGRRQQHLAAPCVISQ